MWAIDVLWWTLSPAKQFIFYSVDNRETLEEAKQVGKNDKICIWSRSSENTEDDGLQMAEMAYLRIMILYTQLFIAEKKAKDYQGHNDSGKVRHVWAP